MIYEMNQYEKLKELFGDWQETLIWSCFQNVMGCMFANDKNEPTAAMAMLGDFCFLAGEPDEELILYKPEYCKKEFIIMIPQNDAWARSIETCYKEKAKAVVRYAFKKEPSIFDENVLQSFVAALPNDYTLRAMDEELFYRCKEMEWCRDWVSQYPDYQTYQRYGIGAIILNGREILSGASSYSSYLGGIEIQVDTREDYRRKGFAQICSAKLILECLKRGWYPSWDAQNKWSANLAKKLGYHYSHTYFAYEIIGY